MTPIKVTIQSQGPRAKGTIEHDQKMVYLDEDTRKFMHINHMSNSYRELSGKPNNSQLHVMSLGVLVYEREFVFLGFERRRGRNVALFFPFEFYFLFVQHYPFHLLFFSF